MIRFQDINIKPKLISLFIIIGLVPLGLVGAVSYFESSMALKKTAFQQLVAVRDNKAFQIQNYFDQMIANAKFLAGSRETEILYEKLKKYHDDMNTGPFQPYDISTERYQRIWDDYGDYYRQVLEDQGFYDIFLVCSAHGHVMFTATKEKDLGTNLRAGPFKDSGLARIWKKIVDTKSLAVEDLSPYAPSDNKPSMFAGVPIFDDKEKVIGTVVVQVSLKRINEIMQNKAGLGETGGAYLVGQDFLMRSNSGLDHTPNSVDTSFADDLTMKTPSVEAALDGKPGQQVISVKAGDKDQEVLSSYTPVSLEDVTWALVAEIDAREAFAAVNDLKNELLLIAVFVIAAVVIIGWLIAMSFIRPINKVVEFTKSFGKGDLTAVIDVDSKDEIGAMARDLNSAASSLRSIMQELTGTTNNLSSSSEELSAVSTQMASSAEEMTSQADTVAAATEEVSASVATVASAAEQSSSSVSNIASMSEEMSSTFSNIAQTSQKTAANVKTIVDASNDMSTNTGNVAASIEEMTASLNEVAKNTAQASQVSRNAHQRSEDINTRMDALVQASKQIGKVVGVIKDIADQTNMLALNATIEAAGAGEAGKGFAVVAGEVKELAKQSADATDEIAGQIEQIQNTTNEAVQAIKEINTTINDIAGINETIASSVEEQTATANEISKTVASNAGMVKNVADNVNEASTLIDEIARSTNEASQTAGEVARHIDELSNGIKEVARSAGEGSRGVQDISKNIQGINTASKQTSTGASQTNESSKELAKMASELSQMVARFKV